MNDTTRSGKIRVIIFSDTHGVSDIMHDAIKELGPFDILVHLGDGATEGIAVAEAFNIQFIGVCGNEDYSADLKEEVILKIYNHSCLLFHGDNLDLNPFLNESLWNEKIKLIGEKAVQADASIVLFGHTHKSMLKKAENILFCNPGSPTVQYLATSQPSYAILEADRKRLSISLIQKKDTVWEIINTEYLY